jgi:hypothetical protein
MWLDISYFQLFNRRYSLYIPPSNDITKHTQGITKILRTVKQNQKPLLCL